MLDGTLRGIEENYFQGALADSAYEFEKAVGTGERSIVGVNVYVDDDDTPIETLVIPEPVELGQRQAVAGVRSARDRQAVDSALKALEEGAQGDANLMELMIDAARVRATEGEIIAALKRVFGSYHESVRI
jgi:methylmalonyl-CoA mutase N-terminal domain/subunit